MIQGVLAARGFWGKGKTVRSKSVSNEELFSTKTPKRGKNFFKVHFLACLRAKNAKLLYYDMSTFSNLPWGIQNSKLNQYLCHNLPNLKGIHNPLGS